MRCGASSTDSEDLQDTAVISLSGNSEWPGADTEDPLVIARRFRETNEPYLRGHGVASPVKTWSRAPVMPSYKERR